MPVKRELFVYLGVLLLLNLLLSVSAIALLSRMGPAIERILRVNVTSLEVAEDMLSTLATTSDTPLPPAVAARLEAGLLKATQHAIEPGEPEIIERMRGEIRRLSAGDPGARLPLVQALAELTATNRAAMVRADQQARRAGVGGAWVAAFAGVFSLWIWWLVSTRVHRRFIRPLLELGDVLHASEHGDVFRRCHSPDAARDWKAVLASVNRVLDTRGAGDVPPAPSSVGLERP